MRVSCALFLAGVVGCAPALADERSGRVDAVYVEVANGVLLEERLAGTRRGARWADIRLGDRKVLARVPEAMSVARGDRIALRLGAPKSDPLVATLPVTAFSRAVGEAPTASIGR